MDKGTVRRIENNLSSYTNWQMCIKLSSTQSQVQISRLRIVVPDVLTDRALDGPSFKVSQSCSFTRSRVYLATATPRPRTSFEYTQHSALHLYPANASVSLFDRLTLCAKN